MTAENPDKPREPSDAPELATLRRSFDADHRRLAELEERVANPELHTRAVSRVLPQAIAIRSRQDRALADALEPTVESALRSAVRDDPKLIADAIYPIIGPAIRKSIFNALSAMVQRLNRARDESLTLHGLAWRWEAIRTGRPFAEVVLMKSLVFRVEQVFLIHRTTGLPLLHVVARSVVVEDPQMVSGMLSAIQDFVRQSFQAGGGETVQSMRVGDVTVALEQGPLAVVAVVIRGVPPDDLRPRLQEIVEKIHAEESEDLAAFDGDSTPFVVVRSLLERCLVEQRRQLGRGYSISKAVCFLAFIAVVLFCLRYLVVLGIVRAERNRLIEAFEREPGYALLSTRIDLVDRQAHVHALRDPLARDWHAVFQGAEVDPQDVVMHWNFYESLDHELLLARARKILEPPSTVTFTLEDGVLHARGSAPHRWIMRAGAQAVVMPGIQAFDAKEVLDPALEEATRLKRLIEAERVTFENGTPPKIVEASLTGFRERLAEIDRAARDAGLFVRIRVIATAREGSPETADLARARSVCSALEGLSFARVQCSPSVGRETSGGDPSTVRFAVDLIDAPELGEDKR
jgi:OOP family OmpA-OmpF porin